MRRRLLIFFVIAAVVAGLLGYRARLQSRAEAELWAAATDEL